MDGGATPPGWPGQVLPPTAPGWEQSAAAWLIDQCPPEFWSYPMLRRHPVVLARFAAAHLSGAAEATRQLLQSVRAELRGVVPPEVVDAAVAAAEREGHRLVRLRHQVDLVDRALRGERFVPRL